MDLEQVAELQRQVNAGRLVAALSHDMRNALATAKTNLEFALEMTEKGPVDHGEMVDSLREGLEGLARAIGSTSTLARLAATSLSVSGRIDVGELARQALVTVGPLFRGRPIELDLPPACLASGRREGLLQALVHLLLEAGESGDHAPLRVSVSTAKSEIRIVVSGARAGAGMKRTLLRTLVRASGGRLSAGRQELRLLLRPYAGESRRRT